MKQSKTLNRLLMVSLMGIWGTIAYQIVDANKDAEPTAASNGRPPGESDRGAEPVAFDVNVRDPFRYFPRKVQVRSQGPDSPDVSLNIPRLTLTGIVANGSRRVAVLEDPTGKVAFASEGDSIQSVLIRRIQETQVEYIYLKRTRRWYLNTQPTISDHTMMQ